MPRTSLSTMPSDVAAALALARELESSRGGASACDGRLLLPAASWLSVSALWERAFSPPGGVRAWYALGAAYWFRVAADDDGMLGGLAAETNAVDTAASMALLRALAARGMGGARALDCGAGAGRVTREVLRHAFDVVDLVEQDERLLRTAVADGSSRRLERWRGDAWEEVGGLGGGGGGVGAGVGGVGGGVGGVGELLCVGLQDLPRALDAAASYDCVWLQWVVGCLADCDLVAVLARAAATLRPGGVIVVKDNVLLPAAADAAGGDAEPCRFFDYDGVDHSICRCEDYLLALVARAGLAVVAAERQADWPADLLPVVAYVLQPGAQSVENGS